MFDLKHEFYKNSYIVVYICIECTQNRIVFQIKPGLFLKIQNIAVQLKMNPAGGVELVLIIVILSSWPTSGEPLCSKSALTSYLNNRADSSDVRVQDFSADIMACIHFI